MSRSRTTTKWLAMGSLGLLLAAALLAPVGAHVNNDVGHVWNDHLKDKATDVFYKKSQSNGRFLPNSPLPDKKSMTGVWGAGGTAEAQLAATDMQSFPQRLKNRPALNLLLPGESTSRCPGSAKKPSAKSGHLCIYVNTEFGIGAYCPFDPVSDALKCEDQLYANRAGFGITVIPDGTEQFGALGTWAVTAGPTPSIPPGTGPASGAGSQKPMGV